MSMSSESAASTASAMAMWRWSELVVELQRSELRRLFNTQLAGRKILVLDQSLLRPLDRITRGMAFLQSLGVERVFKYENKGAVLEGHHVVYVMRPDKDVVSAIASGVLADTSTRQHTLACWPRATWAAEKAVEEAGAWGKLALVDLPLHLLALETDLLSLEMPDVPRHLFLDGDQTALHTVALSLVHLERAWGSGGHALPSYVVVGQHAASTYRLLQVLRSSGGAGAGDNWTVPDPAQVPLSGVVLMSRDVDFVTPLCSQVVYMGLIDDVLGVDAGLVELRPDPTAQPAPHFPGLAETRRVTLTRTADPVLPILGDSHVARVHLLIKAEVRRIEAAMAAKNTAGLAELKQFIERDMRELTRRKQALSLHIQLNEELMRRKHAAQVEAWLATEHDLLAGRQLGDAAQFAAECVHRQVPRREALRLLCLLSLCCDGLGAELLATLKKAFCDSYGVDYLATWHNLARLGLLTSASVSGSTASRFAQLRKRLELVPREPSQAAAEEPRDIDYVTSGAYAPLSARLVEALGLRAANQQLTLDVEEALRQARIPLELHRQVSSARGGGGGGNGALLVYFIGGCTYSEVAALRLLSRRHQRPIMVATTGLINATGLIAAVEQKI